MRHLSSRRGLAVAVAVAALFLARLAALREPASPAAVAAAPQRIVSLAPSVTETLFALGLGDRVVGVTRYCDFPPEARSRQEVGGYLDVNYEVLLSLRPDLVVMIREHAEAAARLAELGVPTLAVDHSRVEGIFDSVTLVARRCGVGEAGADLRGRLEAKVRSVMEMVGAASAAAGPAPRVLVAVGRNMQSGSAGEVYVSGRDGFYDDLLGLAGARNAYELETLKLPALSAEGVARLDPDVVLEMVPDLPDDGEVESLVGFWRSVPGLRAARDGRVHVMGGDHVVVPGPRFPELLREMALLIHGTRPNREGGP